MYVFRESLDLTGRKRLQFKTRDFFQCRGLLRGDTPQSTTVSWLLWMSIFQNCANQSCFFGRPEIDWNANWHEFLHKWKEQVRILFW